MDEIIKLVEVWESQLISIEESLDFMIKNRYHSENILIQMCILSELTDRIEEVKAIILLEDN